MTVQLSQLPNGIRVVSEDMPSIETVSVGAWVNVGARYESKDRHGLSHMLEHMAFKGTKSRNALQIAQAVEDVGGYINAYTGREQTAYYARMLKSDLGLAVDILGDILTQSVFDPQELERERSVILQEIGETNDVPDEQVFDELQRVAFPDQPLGRNILGEAEQVESYQREVLIDYMGDFYSGDAMILAAAGRVDHKQLVELASEAFGTISSNRTAHVEKGRFQGGEFRKVKDLEQVHYALATQGIDYHDPDLYAAQAFLSILGGGASSRLFQEAREKRGLCYGISAYGNSYTDTGLITFYASTASEKLNELNDVILDQLHGVASSVSVEELARAKAQMKAGLAMAMESSSSRCEQLARNLLIYDRVISTEEILGKVDALTIEDVCTFGQSLIERFSPALSILGPSNDLASYDRIASRFTSLEP